MAYQALLFCPDEKTARTVTQVLSELDFAVIPCTEPFAAVKKLMGEHFDAVVVDCDNEQNATLLFKSARNTPNNQSSLAVAVVEGQAGVAKAFRIGANLVLTKPINVEQAKGTLRVARGLLRKNDGAKPATAATSTAVKPAPSAPLPPKPAPRSVVPSVTATRPAMPIAPLATASIPTPKPAPQPRVVSSAPSEIDESDLEILEPADQEMASPKITPAASSHATAESKIEITSSHAEVAASTPAVGNSPASFAGLGTGAASAPAPARDPKSSVSTGDKPSTVISEPESSVEKVAAGESGSSSETSAPAPAFTFGGNVDSGTEAARGGSKKTLQAVAAVVLIAVVGGAAWMQWIRSSGAETPFTHTASQPVVAPVRIPPATPSAALAARSAAVSSPQPSTPDSKVATQQTEIATDSSDTDTTESTESAPVHPSKATTGAVSSKSTASAAAGKASATKPAAAPIVIKNDLSQPAAKPVVIADAPAPSMAGIAPAGNGGTLSNLMGSAGNAPAPVLQTLNVSQGVSRGLLVKQVQPSYPPNALRMHIEGAVELLATVSKGGNISAVKILSGDPSLARAAADAVKQWKYKPYLLNGEPVEIQTQVTVNFKVPR